MRVQLVSGAIGLCAAIGAAGAGLAFGAPLTAGFVGVSVALGVFIGVATIMACRVLFVQPLGEMRDTIRAMQRDGDLSRRAPVSGGQVGEVELVFNELIESLQGIVGKVIFDAQRVYEAADLLSGYAGRVAEGSSGQRDAAESMAVAIEQMTAGVNAVADHASQTAANAQALDAYAPSPKGRENFVKGHQAAAQRVARESGIPAHYMIGQAGHETGWGQSEIRGAGGANSFNLFGIKATGGWTGKVAEITTTEYINGEARKVKAKFRAYDSYEESFRDYARLISQNPRYANAMQATGNAKDYATALQKAGYATDPQYANKLSRAIESAQAVQRGNQA